MDHGLVLLSNCKTNFRVFSRQNFVWPSTSTRLLRALQITKASAPPKRQTSRRHWLWVIGILRPDPAGQVTLLAVPFILIGMQSSTAICLRRWRSTSRAVVANRSVSSGNVHASSGSRKRPLSSIPRPATTDRLPSSQVAFRSGQRELSSAARAESSLLDLLDDRNNKRQTNEDHAGPLHNVGMDGQSSSGGSLLSLLGDEEEESSFDGLSSDNTDDTKNSVFASNYAWGDIDLNQKEKSQRKLIIGEGEDAHGAMIDAHDADDESHAIKMPPLNYQSKANSERLFSAMALHLHKNSWKYLKNRLTRTNTMIHNNLKHFDTTMQNHGRGRLKGIVKRLLLKGGVEEMTVSPAGREAMLHMVVDDMLSAPARKRPHVAQLTLESHGWMKPLLLEYFYNHPDGEKEGTKGKGKAKANESIDVDAVDEENLDEDGNAATWRGPDDPGNETYDPLADPHFPPNINLATIDNTVDVLMRAREKCLTADPLFWSKKKALSSTRSRQRRRRKQAEMAKKNKDAAKEVNVDDETSSSATETSDTDKDPTADLKRSRINLLRVEHEEKDAATLQNETREMVELLARRLPPSAHEALIRKLDEYASGTGGYAPQEVDEDGKKKKMQKARETNIFLTVLRKTVKDHLHLVAADLAKFLYIGIPENIHENDSESAAAEVDGTRTAKQVHSYDDRVNGSWVEWDTSKAELAELLMECQHGIAKVENLLRKEVKLRKQIKALETKEEEEASLAAALKNETERKKFLKKLQRSLKRKGRHAVFDAMLLTDKFAAGPDHVDAAETDRTIFVDCLPVDVSVEELEELYSRCGPIDSVRLFNMRPDLDPGPPTPIERIRLKKNQRRAGGNKQKEDRKRSPVYAKIVFKTEEGYKAASRDELRIFGMVIRRHPARTIRAKEATTLYLENVPPGLYSLDVETKLSRALHPDIYIGLDVGQNDYWRPASCEIRFPSFETALHAFNEIEKIDMHSETAPIDDGGDEDADADALPEPECAIHWMPTPDDASFYYTRQTNFDP